MLSSLSLVYCTRPTIIDGMVVITKVWRNCSQLASSSDEGDAALCTPPLEALTSHRGGEIPDALALGGVTWVLLTQSAHFFKGYYRQYQYKSLTPQAVRDSSNESMRGLDPRAVLGCYEHRLLVRPWHLAHIGLSFVPGGPASSSFLL